jgi:hypothetical protein
LLADQAAIIDVAVAYPTALDTRTWVLEPLFTRMQSGSTPAGSTLSKVLPRWPR